MKNVGRNSRLLMAVATPLVFLFACPDVGEDPPVPDGCITVELAGAAEHDGKMLYFTVESGGETYSSSQFIWDGGATATICEPDTWESPVIFTGGQDFVVEAYIDVDGGGGPAGPITAGIDYVADVVYGVIDGDVTATLEYPADFRIAPGGAPAITVIIDDTYLFSGGAFELGDAVVDIPLRYDVAIENTGTVTLELTGMPVVGKTGVGADMFALDSEPAAVVSSGESTSFTILFSPTSLGVFDVVFSIESNDISNSPFAFTISGTVTEAPLRVPQTGQTSTSAAGDDGDLQYGVSWSEPRFADNADGTTTDTLIGLMWLTTPASVETTWNSAISWASGLTVAGHDDWHVPNVNEFLSLMDAGEANTATALNSSGLFSGIRSDRYWTSTRSYSLSGDAYAWVAWMDDGILSRLGPPHFAKTYSWAVRWAGDGAVELPQTGRRSSSLPEDDGDLELGIAWPYPRFIDLGIGIVADYLTGFMWEKTPDPTWKNWGEALVYADGLSLGGYDDWRLPNSNELRTLMNYDEEVIADWLISSGFEGIQDDAYWTSTTHASSTASAYTVSMLAGHVYYAAKTDSRYAWSVRGGE